MDPNEPLFQRDHFSGRAPWPDLTARLAELQDALHLWMGCDLVPQPLFAGQLSIRWRLSSPRRRPPADPELLVAIVADGRIWTIPHLVVAIRAVHPAAVTRLVGPLGSFDDAEQAAAAAQRLQRLLDLAVGVERAPMWWVSGQSSASDARFGLREYAAEPGSLERVRGFCDAHWQEAERSLFPAMTVQPMVALGFRLEPGDVIGSSTQQVVERIERSFTWCRWTLEELGRFPAEPDPPPPPADEVERRLLEAAGLPSQAIEQRRSSGVTGIF